MRWPLKMLGPPQKIWTPRHQVSQVTDAAGGFSCVPGARCKFWTDHPKQNLTFDRLIVSISGGIQCPQCPGCPGNSRVLRDRHLDRPSDGGSTPVQPSRVLRDRCLDRTSDPLPTLDFWKTVGFEKTQLKVWEISRGKLHIPLVFTHPRWPPLWIFKKYPPPEILTILN